MTQDQMAKRVLRVEFIKAALMGGASGESPYVNFVDPTRVMAKRVWNLGEALAEMEMKHREEQPSASKDSET